MKGRILSQCPGCRIIDLSHGVERHNIVEGAFLLESSVGHFPKKTIHVGVVDPGVGSERLPIIVVCKSGTLVGPDNGLLSLAAEKLGFDQAYRIRESGMRANIVSSTFHGRDIFAHTAAKLAQGTLAKSLGPSVRSIVRLKHSRPQVSEKGMVCSVLYVDGFGNVITNVRQSDVPTWLLSTRALLVQVKGKSKRARFGRTYSDVKLNQLLVLLGSQGYIEVAAREHSAGDLLRVSPRDTLVIRPS